jgi:hypothetical protein
MRHNPLGVAIMGLSHIDVFLERLFTIWHQPILKEDHPKTSIRVCEENGTATLKLGIHQPLSFDFS